MPAEVKTNPTAYAPETDALDYWESLEGMLTVGEETAMSLVPSTKEISMSWEKISQVFL